MPLKFRNKTLLAKVETTYGTDAAPTGAANAIQVMDLSITPQDGETVTHDFVQPDLGARAQIPVNTHVSLEFSVSVAGSGTAGTAPGYGVLLRGCGMAEVIAASASTQASPATGVGTPTGTFTYTAGTAFTGSVLRTVTLTCTTGGGSGVAAFTVSAPQAGAHTAYNQTGVVMTDATPLTLVNGATIVPTVGTSFVSGDSYTILLQPAHVAYQPVGSGEESLTLYFNLAGNRHKLLGARGSVACEFQTGQLPRFRFKFLGLYVGPDAASQPSVDLAPFKQPVPVNNANTPDFSLHGYAGVMKSLTLDLGVQVHLRDFVNSALVAITDRQGSGNVTLEAPAIGTKDFFADAINATLGPLAFVHGVTAGNIVGIDAPKVQVLKPRYGDDQGIAVLEMDLVPTPDAGNDELVITVM
ncbi:MAG: hypothetical protein HQL34_05535 [Alphaproteobacteria bacterium]|nr:hypothetical protein [Alphaproteobacteria bacterium]